jgi:hypothetical protein
MGRTKLSRCIDADGILHKRNLFTAKEDAHLRDLVTRFGIESWEKICASMPGRTCRQCRERWFNYLSPSVRIGPWSDGENALLLEKVCELGLRWKSLVIHFPGRTDINIRNRYRQLQKSLGVSPETILCPKSVIPASEAAMSPGPPELPPSGGRNLTAFDDIIAALVRESENGNPDESTNLFSPHMLF